MNIIIGQTATGDKFYVRKKLIARFWKKIESGSSILMSAPRRIGKTSIMHFCLENPKDGFEVIYEITESVNNKNEFYRKLVRAITEKLSVSEKISNYLQKVVKNKKLKSIGMDGVAFENNNELNYFNEFVQIAEQLELKDHKLIIMVDEFAQTVENIIQDEGNNEAIHFLESVREIRINPEIRKTIQFVFAGSIGLENIVNQLNTNSTINDLYPFKMTVFSNTEALDYIKSIALKNEEYNFPDSEIKYLLKKLEWNIPFFINIILDEIEEICDDKDTNDVSKETIDLAFENALTKRNYFEHWHTRLRKSFKKNNYNFTKEILNQIASNNSISKAELANIAVDLNILESYKDIINTLEFDGYINNLENKNEYVFNSPLLKQWWFNNVTN